MGINQNAPHFVANVPNAHEMGCVLIDSYVRLWGFFTVTSFGSGQLVLILIQVDFGLIKSHFHLL